MQGESTWGEQYYAWNKYTFSTRLLLLVIEPV